MTKYQPEWVFNLSLQLAVMVCLSMLILALALDVPPLTALWRSALVFVVFAVFGWITSLVWQAPEPSEAPVETDSETTTMGEQLATEDQPLS